jgi:hypothetical protein
VTPAPLDPLQELLAERAIREVLYRYCRGLDRMDWTMSYAVWHDDSTALYGGLYEGSGRGFVDWVMKLHEGMVAHSHQITNILIDVDDDGTHAASEAYVTVRLRTHNAAGDLVDILGSGRYCDRWTWRDGRWAIQHRQYVGDLTTSIPVPAASAAGRIPPAGEVRRPESRRDRDDPSYQFLDQ